MKEQTLDKSHGRALIILGAIAIVILFITYARYQNSEFIMPDAVDDFQRMAIAFYIILILLFGAITYGLCKYHKQKASGVTGRISIIASIIYNSRSQKVFIFTFIIYGIFFSLTSGTLVYQPEVSFSYHYKAVIPSIQILPCCDAPGYMPKILVYMTDNIGLQIVPINLVLQVLVSYLVGLNTAIAFSMYALSKKARGIGGIGAVTGLFIACPTCVGSFLSVFVGTASGIALSIALVQLQTLLIMTSIPVLVITPFILAKKLQNSNVCNHA